LAPPAPGESRFPILRLPSYPKRKGAALAYAAASLSSELTIFQDAAAG